MKLASRPTILFLALQSAGAFAPRTAGGAATAVSRFHSASASASASASSVTTDSSSVCSRIENDSLYSTLNEQITNELAASQLYLSASLWCERRNLIGMAAYMRAESDEERSHALSFVDFANKRQMPVQLQSLAAPPSDWDSVVDLWQALLTAEKENTLALQKLDQVADEYKDTALSTFLDSFHLEQVESENSLRNILAKARDMEETPGLLRQLDTELGDQASS